MDASQEPERTSNSCHAVRWAAELALAPRRQAEARPDACCVHESLSVGSVCPESLPKTEVPSARDKLTK